ncbi:tetratricopeptide repeat protein [Rhodobacterales bacterium HKCCE3408]|nr:tetratricopeptide repeat protein [Rhodobacterales bacterium HKCCE3408]
MLRSPALIAACLALALVAGCQSSEERAESHYQSALALLAEGDLERASIEFRNVFRLNGAHAEARAAYAAAIRAAGRRQEAYSQYLRLAEQLPDDPETRIALAEMAIEAGQWDEAGRHGRRALELAPDDPRVRPIGISLDYVAAVDAGDALARRDAADAARALLGQGAESPVLDRLVIDSALRDGDTDAALAAVDAALAGTPDNRTLHELRLAILAEREDTGALEAELRDMIDRFPEDSALVGGLVRFYVSQDRTAEAAGFLRDRIGPETERSRDYAMALVQLVLEAEGPEAALAELDRLSETAPDDLLYGMLNATIRFDTGARDEAIAALQGLIETAPDGSERNDARVTLARMLTQTGNPVGAQRLVDEVLAEDATHIDALKLKAARQIETDDTDGAVATLRTALEQDPEDAGAMTLMAQAHDRNGNPALARDFLGLAVDASGHAPDETLRYAAFLMSEERWLLAEETLIDALRLAPGNLALLARLGEVYVATEDWPRAEQVEQTLTGLDTEDATRAAAGLAAARLAAQGRTEDAVAVLEELADSADGDIPARIAVVRARLAAGDADAARSYAADLLAGDPENPALMLTMGLAEAAAGDVSAAAESFRRLTETHPTLERGWIELIRALNAQGDTEAAQATLARALEALPDAANLLWAEAGFQERAGNIETAIDIYERLYERMPNSEVVANNLASLIATWREDDENLERAYGIARRLRGTEVPAFADTYGWIAFRRGDLEEAESHLALAASGLPGDPIVQYHYARVLVATGQEDAALEAYRRAIDAAAPGDSRPQIAESRSEIARIEAATAQNPGTEAETGE